MRIIQSPQQDQFREEVRDWLADNVPSEERPVEGEAMRQFDRAWQRRQFDGGWAGIAWPAAYGGRGLELLEQIIWFEEYTRAKAPYMGCNFIGLSHAGPTLIVAGSEEQKAFHLPRILRADDIWCQGFSEPGAGSDLASISTSGRVEGNELVINGSKIWTSFGPVADYQELLLRTEPGSQRHGGITWLICDMHAKGVSTRPIKAMSGITQFCETFYDDVRIPLHNVVGGLGNGWKTAMTTLGFERGTATLSHQLELSATVEKLLEIARTVEGPDGGTAIDDHAVAAKLAQLQAEVNALRALSMLSASRALREDVPGAEGNIVALYFCELGKRIYGTAIELLGPEGIEKAKKDWPREYLEYFKYSIGGGTSEIRRNAIGERVLHLPRGNR